MDKQRLIETMQIIADDMESDALAFDGRPFNGRTVAEYFGNQGAAIRAVALALKAMLESPPSADAVDPVASTSHEPSTRVTS